MKIIFTGDVAMRGVEETMDYACAQSLLSEIQPELDDADLRVTNWENPTTTDEGGPIAKSGAMLHSNPKNLQFLRAGKFDAAVLANNHVGDYGPEGALATIKYIDQLGIPTVGAGKDAAEAAKPLFLEKNGETVCILAVCEYEFGIAEAGKPGANAFHARKLKAAIAENKPKADYLVVVFHGGNEYNPLPSPLCRDRYRDIIDMGADALIAMHTHCPQGTEIYNGKPIVYSMGNFFFKWRGEDQTSPWHYGYLTRLTLEKGRQPQVERVPYQFNTTAMCIRPMQGEDKAKMLAYLDELMTHVADEDEHRKLFMGWCMIAAPGYANHIKYNEGWKNDPAVPALLQARNVFTCQAHNELIATYLRMHAEGTLHIGREYEPIVRAMQKMPVNVWEE